jgi:hypothetical protein
MLWRFEVGGNYRDLLVPWGEGAGIVQGSLERFGFKMVTLFNKTENGQFKCVEIVRDHNNN